MRLTKQTGHAIRILTDCAEAGDQLVKVAEISSRLEITKQNVFKIVHILSRAGFVAAMRGPHGGVKLARAPHTIRIGDVVRAIEVTFVEVAGEASPSANNLLPPGSINTVFDDAMSAFVSVLDQHTLADLVISRRAPARPASAGGKAPSKGLDAKADDTKAASQTLGDSASGRRRTAKARRG